MTGMVVFAGYDLIHNNARFNPENYGVVVAAVVVATMPLLAAFVTWFASGKKPASYTMLSLVLALTGVLLVVTKGDLSLLKSMGPALPKKRSFWPVPFAGSSIPGAETGFPDGRLSDIRRSPALWEVFPSTGSWGPGRWPVGFVSRIGDSFIR